MLNHKSHIDYNKPLFPFLELEQLNYECGSKDKCCKKFKKKGKSYCKKCPKVN